jgi:hypothetical protein
MTAFISSLGNLLTQITKSAQLSTLVPATILVLYNLIFVFPALDIAIKDSNQTSLVVLATITISYLLWLLNGPFIRFFEGYKFEETKFGRFMIKKQSDQLQRLEENLKKCRIHLERADNWLENIIPLRYLENISEVQNDPEYKRVFQLSEHWQAIQLRDFEERLNHFPPPLKPLLPTRLGNTLAAFEYYPLLRYGIKSPIVWPRLIPFLDKSGFLAYVEREKSAFDFLLNLSVITAAVGIECVGLAARFLQPVWLIGSAVAAIIVIASYHTLVINAVYWGNMVKVAFDLYRHDLRKALLVRQPDSLDDERRLWESISNFLAENQSPPSKVWDYSLLQEKEKQKERDKRKEE